MPQHRPLLIGLLLAASALADLALLLPSETRYWPEPMRVLGTALLASQVSLLTIWVSLSARGADLRLCLVALFCGVAAWFAQRGGERGDDTYVLLIALAAVELLMLLPLRWRGLRLRAQVTGDVAAEGARRQFSLARLMGWTASLAVAFGLGRAFGIVPESAWPVVLGLLIALACSLAALSCLALWAACSPPHAPARVLLVLALAPAFSLPAQAIVPFARAEALSTGALFLAHAGLLIGGLVVFRVAGYRLSWMEYAADDQWRTIN